jgi:hypothetical protein
MKLRLVSAIAAVALLVPAIARAHELTMSEAKKAANAELKSDVKWWRHKGYSVSNARVGSCDYYSDHEVDCAAYMTIDGDHCANEYRVRFTSSTKRRIGVDSDFFDCGDAYR